MIDVESESDSSVDVFSMIFDGVEYKMKSNSEDEKVSCIRPTVATAEFARRLICFDGRVLTVNEVEKDFVSNDVKREICIPSSVEIICERCFSQCDTISFVSFESEAKLSRIGESAFGFCSSLS
jgi:hypothetical protein